MSLFPKVQSPCPYKGKFADIMQGNQCRLCKRNVIDLTDMSDGERQQFLSACEGEVCVSYRVGAKSALAAMAMSTVAVPSVAAAQDTQETEGAAEEIEEHFEDEVFYIIVGGMKKPGDAEWIEDTQRKDADSEASELPVEYEDEAPAEKKPAKEPSKG